MYYLLLKKPSYGLADAAVTGDLIDDFKSHSVIYKIPQNAKCFENSTT